MDHLYASLENGTNPRLRKSVGDVSISATQIQAMGGLENDVGVISSGSWFQPENENRHFDILIEVPPVLLRGRHHTSAF
jgi:hypothetical protein